MPIGAFSLLVHPLPKVTYNEIHICFQDVWRHVVPSSCLLLSFEQENLQT